MIKIKKGFTMAEMMVVMLVLTVLLAAAAPLMTKKKSMSTDTTWKYASNNSDIYYGVGDNQSAMIGQTSKSGNDLNSKLIISTNDFKKPFITFKQNHPVANMIFDGNFIIGGPYSTADQYKIGGAYNNTALGYKALYKTTSGYYNTAIGDSALLNNTEADRNTAVGFKALMNNTTGSDNTAIGEVSLENNTIGEKNTALGTHSLRANTTGSSNTAIGYEALNINKTGSSNTAIGNGALVRNTTGSSNIAIGYGALGNNSSGSNNIAIGDGACGNVTTGSNKVCIGNGSGPKIGHAQQTSSDNVVYIGDENTTVYIPGNLIVGKTAILGFNEADKKATYIRTTHGGLEGTEEFFITAISEHSHETLMSKMYDWNYNEINSFRNLLSDKRLKNVKGENKAGIEQIRQLRIFDYTFKKDPNKIKHVGVMAQDLEKVFPNAVTKGDDGYLRIRQEDMFYAVINAVKQLDKIIEALIAEVKVDLAKIVKIDKQVTKLEKENKLLKEKNIKLEKRIEKLEKAILEDDDDDDDDD